MNYKTFGAISFWLHFSKDKIQTWVIGQLQHIFLAWLMYIFLNMYIKNAVKSRPNITMKYIEELKFNYIMISFCNFFFILHILYVFYFIYYFYYSL